MTNEELVNDIKGGKDKVNNLGRLYQQNKGFISNIAKKYVAYAEYDDLMQEAYFALEKATEYFNPDINSKFITYAGYWLHQYIRRYIDNNGRSIRIPSWKRDMIYKYRRIQEVSLKTTGKHATADYVAALLGLSVEQAESIIQESMIMEISSLDAPVITDEGHGTTLQDIISAENSIEDSVLDKVQSDELATVLWNAVDGLPDRQAAVIHKRFQEGLTRRECARELCVSTQNVATCEHNALRKLSRNKLLQDFYEIEAEAFHHIGIAGFQRTSTSATERVAIKLLELVKYHEGAGLDAEIQKILDESKDAI